MSLMEELKKLRQEQEKERKINRILTIIEDYKEGCYPELHACTNINKKK